MSIKEGYEELKNHRFPDNPTGSKVGDVIECLSQNEAIWRAAGEIAAFASH